MSTPSLDDELTKPTSALDSSRIVRGERLAFPPIYVLVGAYRLLTDKNLYIPTWDKCKHGFVRGAIVGLGWATVTFNIQRTFVEVFLRNSPRVTGLSHDRLFGYQLPFSITTYATLLFLSNQLTVILTFFLSKNLRIARDRAWDHTVRSRGKTPDFWGPYVEEFAVPPRPRKGGGWEKWAGSFVGRFFIRRVLLLPLNFYPVIGIFVGAYLKAIGTARYLHNRYFEAKKMSKDQIAIFMEERNWHYRAFGFTASLLEGLPIVGLVFSISNRVGAAMWAHDLEKRQHEFASGQVKPIMPTPSSETELRPMVGGWKDADSTSEDPIPKEL
ncbi:uncharacterized protein FOMMEDRAFT_161388 [Fomitiporia mediterranea MF3/22]|uniref:uncharacterized protein n=1 Tax=Fomitiporia mediterranea (strain MF3/22) TaxID=694068 RepID=UPI0004408D03|nr:uncharacterized protein FOMMEDRAFT_161388 [Fomitiporia mediterranea MF3/22]EJC98572.1 hypothetical protein FOMMEDRAFT_161388 [Fomitiporia mediterranea MF3/22]